MPSAGTPAGAGAPRPPVTETQIKPPQIPPQALRPPTAAAAASASSGASVVIPGAGAPASAAHSAGASSAGSSASPPGAQMTRVPPPVPPKSTPIPAPTVPLVQETPVPAPQIPGFNTPPSSGAGATGSTFKGTPPKSSASTSVPPHAQTKVVPPVPPLSGAKAAKQASTTIPKPPKTETAGSQASASLSQAETRKQESSTPERKQQQRAWSPPRPPISPVLAPADMPPHLQPMATGSGTFYKPNFAAGRPLFKYTEAAREAAASNAHAEAHAQAHAQAQAAMTAGAGDSASDLADATSQLPPGPVAIDFSTNPDVLALSSTVSILQIQRKKALDDIRKLQLAKEAALENPEAFIRQLQNTPAAANLGGIGRGASTAPLFPASPQHGRKDSSNSNNTNRQSSRDQSVIDKDGDVDMVMDAGGGGGGAPPPAGSNSNSGSRRGSAASSSFSEDSAPADPVFNAVDLRNLPKPQNVVRMPHINWNKYAIVGEGLEKLHAEQVRRPPVGQPATASVLRAGEGHEHDDVGGPRVDFGAVNFGGGPGASSASPSRVGASAALYTFEGGYENAAAAAENTPAAPVYRGISAPYDPMVDTLEIEQPQLAAGHRSSAGSTPGETGPAAVFGASGASFSSAGTGAGAGRGASNASIVGAAQPSTYTAAPHAAPAPGGPPAASTRRSKSSKSSQPRRR